MKTKIKNTLLLMFLTISLGINAQFKSRISKQTEVVFVVDQKSQSVKSLQLVSDIQDLMEIQDLMNIQDLMEIQRLMKKYPGCNFFMGLLKGDYQKTRLGIVPQQNAMLTLFKEKNINVLDKQDKTGKISVEDKLGNFSPGDNFKVNSVKTVVVSNSKTELVLKTGHAEIIKSPVNKKLNKL